ncbi:MAG: WYL domain-containing protein [Chitinophagaceae bacterium]|nr:WYL domain-containing protein [Chitinophagaceae bacterium]
MSVQGKIQQYLIVLGALQSKPRNGQYLIEQLQDKGFTISKRTFSRLLESIRHDFGFEIEYNPSANKYTLENLMNTDYVRLINLFKAAQEASFYQSLMNASVDERKIVQVGADRQFKGIDLLPQLYEAIKAHKVISFQHQSFHRSTPIVITLQPYMLKEHQYMWYLVGKQMNDDKIWIYGIDRITALTVGKKSFKPDKLFPYDILFEDVVGLDFSAASTMNLVLKVDALQAGYFRSLPLHQSQKQTRIHADGSTEFTYTVKENRELIQQILKWGESLEVIAPAGFRKKITSKLKIASQKYK